LGQYALPWGVETPLLPVGAGRCGTALLDLMVGEPVAYATGSPELKAIGPCNSGFELPDHQESERSVCGGVPQTLLLGERDPVARARERRSRALESQAVAAHRAYVEALAEWERAFQAAHGPACEADDARGRTRALRCASAEAEKERRRLVFRDLCDELGYVPVGHGVALPCAARSSGDG
jgi:hypothetical protein